MASARSNRTPETIRLPLAALKVCEGRDDGLVTLDAGPGDQVRLSWNDRGVPRESEQVQSQAGATAFPIAPLTLEANGSGLGAAPGRRP